MHDEVPALHDTKRAEVSGSWIGYDRTNVVFRPDGKADIRLLDGQEWDFDDRWRLSGTGTWKLTDKRTGWNDGRHVQLTPTSRTAVATRAPEPNEPLDPLADRLQTPKTYTWSELRARQAGRVRSHPGLVTLTNINTLRAMSLKASHFGVLQPGRHRSPCAPHGLGGFVTPVTRRRACC